MKELFDAVFCKVVKAAIALVLVCSTVASIAYGWEGAEVLYGLAGTAVAWYFREEK